MTPSAQQSKPWERAFFKEVHGAWRQESTLFSEEEVFAAFAKHVQFFGSDKTRVTLSLGASNGPIDDRHALPSQLDHNLSRYAERISDNYPNASLFVALHGLEKSSTYVWLKTRDFAHRLLEPKRSIPQQLYVVGFMSKGKSTPFGVHTDIFHNFTFILHGSKKIRVWPREALDPYYPGLGRRARPGLTEYSRHLRSSHLLEGDAGDVFFWPDSCWHVGEEGDELSATLVVSIDMQVESKALMRVWGLGEEVIGKEEPEPLREGYHLSDSFPSELLPREFNAFITKTNRSAIEEKWLLHLSSYGFATAIPKLSDAYSSSVQRAKGDLRYPIFYRRNGQALDVFANGHLLSFPHSPSCEEVLEKINLGESLSKEELGVNERFLFESLVKVSVLREAN